MPTRFIQEGLNYVQVARRAGLLVNYKMVIKKEMCLDDFYIIDEWLQVLVKQFGQINQLNKTNTINSEVYILKVLESKQEFECCSDFSIVPISKNGIEYNGDEIEIPFDSICAIIPSGRISYIYASTNPIQPQIPDIYLVGFSVEELWDYINTCACPSI